MSDRNGAPPDRKNVATQEEREVRCWAHAFGVSREQLQAAVDAVGSSPAQVREYLRKRC